MVPNSVTIIGSNTNCSCTLNDPWHHAYRTVAFNMVIEFGTAVYRNVASFNVRWIFYLFRPVLWLLIMTFYLQKRQNFDFSKTKTAACEIPLTFSFPSLPLSALHPSLSIPLNCCPFLRHLLSLPSQLQIGSLKLARSLGECWNVSLPKTLPQMFLSDWLFYNVCMHKLKILPHYCC